MKSMVTKQMPLINSKVLNEKRKYFESLNLVKLYHGTFMSIQIQRPKVYDKSLELLIKMLIKKFRIYINRCSFFNLKSSSFKIQSSSKNKFF